MTRPYRIASVFTALHVGGDENRLLQQLLHRDRDRFEHLVVVLLAISPEIEQRGGPMVARYRAAGVEVVELGQLPFRLLPPLTAPLAAARKGLLFARAVRQVAGLLRRRQIELVDARCSPGILLAVPAARLAGGLPVVATDYGAQFWSRGTWLAGQAALAGIDTMISDSRVKLDEMLRFALRPPRGELVPNGIAPPPVECSRAEMDALLGLPPGVPLVGQVARLIEFKGQRTLLEAAPRILARVPDAHFLLCGFVQVYDSYRRSLEQRIRELGLTQRVRLYSHPGNVGDVFHRLDLHCHPTRLDSSPLSILEAMSLGRPTISTDVGGIAELVVDGETGRVLPAGIGPEALADAVADALLDPERLRRWGAAARARHRSRHAPEVMAGRLEEIQAEVIERHRRKRTGKTPGR